MTLNYDEKNYDAIYKFFSNAGMPSNGIYGLIGNLYVESGLRPNNLQNGYNTKFGMSDEEYAKAVDNASYLGFSTDKAGYGLAQWTSSGRKEGLFKYLKNDGLSIADMTGQLEYLLYELRTAYKSVYNTLMDKNSTIEECAKIVMLKFERPKNQSEENQQVRVNYALAFRDKHTIKVDEKYKNGYVMSAKKLVETCQKLLTVPTLYVYGGLGGAMHERNINRYKGNYQQKANINGNMFGFDCVGMIKSILWGFAFSTDAKYNYGGACVPSNNVPNTGARKFFNDYCKDISNDWNNVIPGEAIWLNGNPDSHIAVYVGNGQCIECTPKWDNGVQLTNIRNMGKTEGKSRTWLYHGKLPWIDYSEVANVKVSSVNDIIKEKKEEYYTVVKGDNLSKIAKKFGYKSYTELLPLNPSIKNPSLISVGQKIRIR